MKSLNRFLLSQTSSDTGGAACSHHHNPFIDHTYSQTCNYILLTSFRGEPCQTFPNCLKYHILRKVPKQTDESMSTLHPSSTSPSPKRPHPSTSKLKLKTTLCIPPTETPSHPNLTGGSAYRSGTVPYSTWPSSLLKFTDSVHINDDDNDDDNKQR